MKPSTRAVLVALRQAGVGGLTTGQLGEALGYRFSARIRELRELGYHVETQRLTSTQSRYRLVFEPVDEVDAEPIPDDLDAGPSWFQQPAPAPLPNPAEHGDTLLAEHQQQQLFEQAA